MEYTSRMNSYVKSGDILNLIKEDTYGQDLGINDKNIENAKK